MAQMTDPTPAMESFQEELQKGRLRLQPGRLDSKLYVYADAVHGKPRFVYVRLNDTTRTVLAYACFTPADPVDGSPCLQVGYAVPAAHRNKGLATSVLRAGMAELQNGFQGMPPFYVEAIVGVDNIDSQHVAANVLSDEPKAVTDKVSGESAFQYLRKVEPPSAR